MAISHTFGSDLQLSPTGDLATATVPDLTVQRLLRRLLTNPTDYIWQLNYGAGLAAMVGQPADPLAIAGVIQAQMLLETAVAANPPPTVTVSGAPDGTVFAQVQYTDAASGQTQAFTVPIN